MTGKQWVKKFKKHGWKVYKITDSHYFLTKGKLTECIAYHTQDIGKKAESKLRKKLEKGDEQDA